MAYTDEKNLEILLKKCGVPEVIGCENKKIKFVYQGVYAGELVRSMVFAEIQSDIFFMENQWRPMIQASRSKITWLPLEVGLYIYVITDKYETLNLFPPMLFCKAANDISRKYLCSAYAFERKK